MAPVKINDCGIGEQFLDPNRSLQDAIGFGIELGKAPVETREARVAQDRVDQVLAGFFVVLLARHGPVACGEQDRYGR